MIRQAPLHLPTVLERNTTAGWCFTPFSRRVRQSNRANGKVKPGVSVPILPLLYGLSVFPAESHATQTAGPDPMALLEWASGESAERLFRSSRKADFFPPRNHFISQDNVVFCGPVSLAIVLDALRLGKKNGLPRGPAINCAGRIGLSSGRRRPVLREIYARQRPYRADLNAARGPRQAHPHRRRSGAKSPRTSPPGAISCWSTLRTGDSGKKATVTSRRSGRKTNAVIQSWSWMSIPTARRATRVRVETRGPIAAMRAFDTVENRTTPW